MTKVLLPSEGPSSWQRLLAKPDLHWVKHLVQHHRLVDRKALQERLVEDERGTHRIGLSQIVRRIAGMQPCAARADEVSCDQRGSRFAQRATRSLSGRNRPM